MGKQNYLSLRLKEIFYKSLKKGEITTDSSDCEFSRTILTLENIDKYNIQLIGERQVPVLRTRTESASSTIEFNKQLEVLEILQKEVEEAMAIEMPSLQQNLPIVATLTTLGTLVGLLGTVMGMIKSFQAMSSGDGGADSTQLATGISEALVNTAFGIATGALAVITYNFYTNKIDNLTYAIDEIGFSIVATFAATH
mgnify:CR=1 FL=1